MDRMLVVVFDNESKAYEGKKALSELDIDGSISCLRPRGGAEKSRRHHNGERKR